MLYKRTSFALQEHAGFKTFQTMPDVLGDVNTIGATFLTDDTGFQHLTIIIIGGYSDFTFQYHKGLGLVRMMVNRDECPRFQGIEETVALVLQALVEVVVHAQSRRFLRLFYDTAN